MLCLQETKAQEHQLGDAAYRPDGYRAWFKDASTKKGYSGVAIYSRREPDEVLTAMGWAAFDDEGRYIEARFGNLSVVSFYIPSGSSGELRQGFKFEVMEWLEPSWMSWLASGRDYVLCGDWNIVRCAWTSRTGPATRRTPAACRPSATGSTACAWTRHGLGRCVPRAARARAGLHLVEQSWRRPRQQRRVAHRLPVRDAALRDRLQACSIHPRAAFFRPRAVYRRL